jgi:3-oxoadipate enol-lactonase
VSVIADYVEVEPEVHLFCRHARPRAGGPAGAPVLLLHGNRDNHAHFAELQALLSKRRHTVAIDFRGHGLSSKVDCAISPELLAADVDAVRRHYGWDRVVLAGHSLGSVTSIRFAQRWPEQVTRLILLGSEASFTLKFCRPGLPVDEAGFAEVIREANRRAAPLFFHPAYPDVQRRVIATWSTIPLKVHRNLVALEHPDLRGAIPQLSMATLVIAGEHDRCTTVEQARWIHDHLPDSELFVVPDTAHFMYVEQPAAVAERIEGFLGRL